uniref:Uncharacterized protein n=1 Tax=Pundamilia nyererei TaxID=303518 RepID=A0A3B4GNQ2_9CICH
MLLKTNASRCVLSCVPDKKHLVLEQTSVHKRRLANDHEDKEQLYWSNVLWTQSCFCTVSADVFRANQRKLFRRASNQP